MTNYFADQLSTIFFLSNVRVVLQSKSFDIGVSIYNKNVQIGVGLKAQIVFGVPNSEAEYFPDNIFSKRVKLYNV